MNPSHRIALSLACYLKHNHPLDYAAVGYMAIRHIGANAGEMIAQGISERVGEPMEVTLIHDGTAAGRALAGRGADVVIMLGTWLGLGFVPDEHSLVPLGESLVVQHSADYSSR